MVYCSICNCWRPWWSSDASRWGGYSLFIHSKTLLGRRRVCSLSIISDSFCFGWNIFLVCQFFTKLLLNPYNWVISPLNYVAYAKVYLSLVMSIFWLGLYIWHLWQIRSLDTLRTRFSSLPTAFVKRLHPSKGSGSYQMYIHGTHVML